VEGEDERMHVFSEAHGLKGLSSTVKWPSGNLHVHNIADILIAEAGMTLSRCQPNGWRRYRCSVRR
jgi:hypothetical protein